MHKLESKIVLLHMDIDKLKDENNKMSDQLVAMLDVHAPQTTVQHKPKNREQSSGFFGNMSIAAELTKGNPMAQSSRPRDLMAKMNRQSAPLGGLKGI